MLLRTAARHLTRSSRTASNVDIGRMSATAIGGNCGSHQNDYRRRIHLAIHPSRSAAAAFMSSRPSSTNTAAAIHAPPAQQVATAFPSLLIGANGSLTPQGSFAEAQASFLDPPADTVEALLHNLMTHKIGIVAHYYMDVELQGVLHAVRQRQMQLHSDGAENVPSTPLVAVADSLKMGDDATDMCRHAGVRAVICLGVDFMSESVNAILDRNGFEDVPVYRAAQRHIGCSLAESAETDSYRAWLTKANAGTNAAAAANGDGSSSNVHSKKKSLHVVYINTSLETKAVSSSILPTITCTSSNVLQTILQASAQIGPDKLQICYGPDTYMGENLISLLDAILDSTNSGSSDNNDNNNKNDNNKNNNNNNNNNATSWDDARIARELHPQHNIQSLRALRNNMNIYPSGNCVVHHMFGQSVVDAVQTHYKDAYVTAHLEVPGEMFQVALQKSLRGEGVVGSTSNILNFIEKKVEEAAAAAAATTSGGDGDEKRRLQFILGTEAGMVTSIVKSVQGILDSNQCRNVEAEIVFPVSSEAVMSVQDDDTNDANNNNNTTAHNATTKLEVVPGVVGGEGCSTAGGCATCPFMKMNDLDAVQDIVEMIIRGQQMDNDTATDHKNAAANATVNNLRLQLSKHLPPNRLKGKMIGGRDAIELGVEPIVYMREFMKSKRLSDDLVARIERSG